MGDTAAITTAASTTVEDESGSATTIKSNSTPVPIYVPISPVPISPESTSPSSYDLLVNLMDHFNLNVIINSLSEDTLEEQIKVTKFDDSSEELLQESVVIPAVPLTETTAKTTQEFDENI